MKKHIIIFIIFLIIIIIACTTPEEIQYTLTTNVNGNGSITLDPTGGVYDEGTVVTVTAANDNGYLFSGWTGDLSGTTNPSNITMDGNKSITANFIKGWVQATPSADWVARQSHSSVVFDDKIWIMGGYYFGNFNDVWYSSDGVNWTKATSAAQWNAREAHSSVVFDDKIWIMGGYNASGSATFFNDVWYSSDGVNWTEATSGAQWHARIQHSSVVFDNKIWIMGGYYFGNGNFQNDVWYSSDGIDWTEATSEAPWTDRATHSSVVFDGKMWVMAGNGRNDAYFNDVWYSSDGVNWTEATPEAQWTGRYSPSCLVLDGKMWIMGGYYDDGSNGICFNDVWYSSDGVNWTQAASAAQWHGRYSFASVVFDGKMWIMGGCRHQYGLPNIYFNDVWFGIY